MRQVAFRCNLPGCLPNMFMQCILSLHNVQFNILDYAKKVLLHEINDKPQIATIFGLAKKQFWFK